MGSNNYNSNNRTAYHYPTSNNCSGYYSCTNYCDPNCTNYCDTCGSCLHNIYRFTIQQEHGEHDIE